jgi:hypothetical protein
VASLASALQDELIQQCRHLESLTYGRAPEEVVRAAEELCRDGESRMPSPKRSLAAGCWGARTCYLKDSELREKAL